jgi:acetyl-CoA hydrolase
MLLADLGAEVILIERPSKGNGDPLDLGRRNILNRGKRSIRIDLKHSKAKELVLSMLGRSDALIEGMRPGVMERLGLGPEVCLCRNPKLVYGRMTGWGQDGPLAQRAGHDINYIALSGALWYSGQPGEAPMAPPTLVGDLGGGALYLVLGVLAGILSAKVTGNGQVVDAAIVDGSASLMNLLLSLHAAGSMPMARGAGLLDGPYWYCNYRCADGKFMSVGAMEPQFQCECITRLGLAADPVFSRPYDSATWAAGRERLAHVFSTESQTHWCRIFEGSDACVSPVLDPCDAASHPHLIARDVYAVRDGILQANPAPRFSATPPLIPGPVPLPGGDWLPILQDIGLSRDEAESWLDRGVVLPPDDSSR